MQDELIARIEQLRSEIKAMKENPSLKDETYGKKVKELMKLRLIQTRQGRKSASK
jgi:hypothetical protein